jgi:flagellar hook-length control protein FliK
MNTINFNLTATNQSSLKNAPKLSVSNGVVAFKTILSEQNTAHTASEKLTATVLPSKSSPLSLDTIKNQSTEALSNTNTLQPQNPAALDTRGERAQLAQRLTGTLITTPPEQQAVDTQKTMSSSLNGNLNPSQTTQGGDSPIPSITKHIQSTIEKSPGATPIATEKSPVVAGSTQTATEKSPIVAGSTPLSAEKSTVATSLAQSAAGHDPAVMMARVLKPVNMQEKMTTPLPIVENNAKSVSVKTAILPPSPKMIALDHQAQSMPVKEETTQPHANRNSDTTDIPLTVDTTQATIDTTLPAPQLIAIPTPIVPSDRPNKTPAETSQINDARLSHAFQTNTAPRTLTTGANTSIRKISDNATATQTLQPFRLATGTPVSTAPATLTASVKSDISVTPTAPVTSAASVKSDIPVVSATPATLTASVKSDISVTPTAPVTSAASVKSDIPVASAAFVRTTPATSGIHDTSDKSIVSARPLTSDTKAGNDGTQQFVQNINENLNKTSDIQSPAQLASNFISPPQTVQTPQAHTAINSYFGSTAWSNEVNQSVVLMTRGADHSATLTLNPPNLGPVQVVIDLNNAQAQATFTSDNPDVRQALQENIANLRDMMKIAGVDLGQVNVNAGGNSSQSGKQTPNLPYSNGNQAGKGVQAALPPTQARVTGSRGLVNTYA